MTLERSPSTTESDRPQSWRRRQASSVRACATITPDRSTPRWSFFHPRLPCPPCFATAHAPWPTTRQAGAIDDELDGARGPGCDGASQRAADSAARVWSGPARPDRRPARPGPTARTPPSSARASRRRAGGPTQSRSPHPRTASARQVDRRATVVTRPWHRQRATGSRHLAGRALARTPASSRRDTLSCISEAPSTSSARSCAGRDNRTSRLTDARRREGQEPCTKATPWRGGYVEKGIGHSRNRSGAIITHTLTDDATTELTLIDAVDGDLASVTADGPARWGCREPPSNHAGDKRLRGQAGDGVDPRGAVAAVTTAQAEREFCHAHVGDGCVGGSAPRRDPRVSDDRRYRMSRRTSTRPSA